MNLSLNSNNYRTVRKTGSDIDTIAHDFARLRIKVFRDFPYLYEGSEEYETEYIKTYSECPEAMIFGIYDDNILAGATTCIPLIYETEEVKLPFEKAGYDIRKIFYFGESMLLKPYRGKGFGHLFFDEREKYVRELRQFSLTTFCSVERKSDHSLRPADYRPNDTFWNKRGYEERSDLYCYMKWLDIDKNEEDDKKLIFWTKSIN